LKQSIGKSPPAENLMARLLPRSGQKSSVVLPVLTVLLAAAIFAADTITNLDIAVPVLYVAVVLLSVRFCETRGVILVAAGCMALTILSYLLTNAGSKQEGLVNTAISLLAVGLTTFLAIRIESAKFTAKTLLEADQLRDALIGSVSHELRTPLASILGGASILADMPSVMRDPRLSSLANGIRDEAMRLNSDIQNLLDAALITSQGLHSRRDWTDPTDVIDAAVERIRARFPHRSIELDLGRDLPLVHIDPVLVEQALSQIIANAAKFSTAPSPIRVNAGVKEGELMIAIRDEGVGLSAEEKSRLSERFFRGQRHVGKISGSGLGLWIANTFIVSSGGSLAALSSGEGQGTTIQVVFPNATHIDDTSVNTDA
jgi:two-component system sensor histidine kinase KdpD